MYSTHASEKYLLISVQNNCKKMYLLWTGYAVDLPYLGHIFHESAFWFNAFIDLLFMPTTNNKMHIKLLTLAGSWHLFKLKLIYSTKRERGNSKP